MHHHHIQSLTTMKTIFQLGTRGYHATASEFDGQIKVHIRKYDEELGRKFPTKDGIALSLEEWTQLKDIMPKLVQDIKTPTNTSLFSLGPRGYHATVRLYRDEILIHIRKFFDGTHEKYLGMKLATKDGLALTVQEFSNLENVVNKVDGLIDARQNLL